VRAAIKLETTLNLKTAKAGGLTVPSLLAADTAAHPRGPRACEGRRLSAAWVVVGLIVAGLTFANTR
jgi:hypothetical protein